MPIPFILGALALGAAGYGVKKGMDAKEDYELAESNNQRANSIVEKTKDEIDKQRKATSGGIESLGKEKIDIISHSIKDFCDIYSKIKNIEISDSKGLDELKKFKPESPEFKKLKEASLEASSMLLAAGGSIAAGTALAAGTYGAVMTGGFAVASTGASIAGLGGVAATNATLAWLGGGSLAAGGMGMAGGMAVLGGLVAGPALAIGGAFMASKAEEAYYQSRSNVEKAEAYEEEGKNICTMLKAVKERALQIENVLHRLDGNFQVFITDMASVVERKGNDFKLYSQDDKKIIYKAGLTAQTIKCILDTSLLTEDGKLDDSSKASVTKGKLYLMEIEQEDDESEEIYFGN